MVEMEGSGSGSAGPGCGSGSGKMMPVRPDPYPHHLIRIQYFVESGSGSSLLLNTDPIRIRIQAKIYYDKFWKKYIIGKFLSKTVRYGMPSWTRTMDALTVQTRNFSLVFNFFGANWLNWIRIRDTAFNTLCFVPFYYTVLPSHARATP
jgi:hypothetical protein